MCDSTSGDYYTRTGQGTVKLLYLSSDNRVRFLGILSDLRSSPAMGSTAATHAPVPPSVRGSVLGYITARQNIVLIRTLAYLARAGLSVLYAPRETWGGRDTVACITKRTDNAGALRIQLLRPLVGENDRPVVRNIQRQDVGRDWVEWPYQLRHHRSRHG